MLKQSLKSQLALTIAIVVFVTVALISVLSNIFIKKQFEDYIVKQQVEEANELVSNLSRQYNREKERWDMASVSMLGMYALYEGYIIKVYDQNHNSVWDAELHNMSLCTMVMQDISAQMLKKYPKIEGQFTSQDYPIVNEGQEIGSVTIIHYGPYFLNDNDFQFIKSLNMILAAIGLFSLLISIWIGWIRARQISKPITDTIMITKEIADGNYQLRLEQKANIKELDELVYAANHLASFLKKQEELRKRMFADVAHELRTPLTIVSTHLEAIIEGIWDPDKERLQSCYDEIGRITKLVKELEQLARVEGDLFKLNKTVFNIRECLQPIYDNLEAEVHKKNLQLTIDGGDPCLYADKDRMSQVLLNLLSNAIKYTAQAGAIFVVLDEVEGQVVIEIRDTGIGISEEDLPFIFERFYRVDKSRNRRTGGAGIGLAIVKTIVQAHQGKIEVESEIGRGSTFVLTFPQ